MDIDQFIVDCKVALNGGIPTKVVREVVAHAVSDERAAIKALGIPQQGGVQKIYVSDELTILNIVWAPGLEIMPHNHNMFAVIGLYGGREDNMFWRKIGGGDGSGGERAGSHRYYQAARHGDADVTAELDASLFKVSINNINKVYVLLYSLRDIWVRRMHECRSDHTERE